jgi:four helix bundle protein
MTKFKTFEEIVAWQKARQLNVEIYNLTCKNEFFREYALRDQIKRSIISVSSNIAEGFERETRKEFKRFLYIAKGSIGEFRSQLYLASDLKLISTIEFNNLRQKAEEISKMLNGLIKYLVKPNR